MRVPNRTFDRLGRSTTDRLSEGATLSVQNLELVDTFVVFGPTEVAATVSFDVKFTPIKDTRQFYTPGSDDPTDPTNFSADLRNAIATGTFSGSNANGFSFTSSTASSEGLFAIIGREKNGHFLDPKDKKDDDADDDEKDDDDDEKDDD